MSELSRRERIRAETLREIREIGARQVDEGGLAALSLNAIAKEMGMSGPALYRYFASRDELLAALIVDGYGELTRAVETADRAGVMAMLTLDRYLDLIIPRGGEEFVRLVAERSTVPVLKHDRGLCHLYVDEGADLEMALAVTINAKAQRVSVCNALETLLVHAAIAPALLPRLAARLA